MTERQLKIAYATHRLSAEQVVTAVAPHLDTYAAAEIACDVRKYWPRIVYARSNETAGTA